MSNGTATRNVRGESPVRGATAVGGGGGTIGGAMSGALDSVSVISSMFPVMSSATFSVTATDTTVRAVLALALAVVAIVAIDRLKPATPKRTLPLRVDQRPTPLYRDPTREQRLRAAANLGAGALMLGALAATLLGLVLAFVLEVVGGLLRS